MYRMPLAVSFQSLLLSFTQIIFALCHNSVACIKICGLG